MRFLPPKSIIVHMHVYSAHYGSRHRNNQIHEFRIPNVLFTCLINSRARHSAIYKLKSQNQKSIQKFSCKYWGFRICEFGCSMTWARYLLLKWCPIFDSSPLTQFLKFNNFLWKGKKIKTFLILYSPLENTTTSITTIIHHCLVLVFAMKISVFFQIVPTYHLGDILLICHTI